MSNFNRKSHLSLDIENLIELESACFDLFLSDKQRKAIDLLIKAFSSAKEQATLSPQNKKEICQAKYEFARSKQPFNSEQDILRSLADLLRCVDIIKQGTLEEFKWLFACGYCLHFLKLDLLAICSLQLAFIINLEDKACDQLLNECFSNLQMLRFPKSYYKAAQQKAQQAHQAAGDDDSLLISEGKQAAEAPFDFTELFDVCQKLTDQNKVDQIIELILDIPEEQRTPGVWSELGRAYNNLGRTMANGEENFKKALACLLPYAEQLSNDHCWNYRVGFAYFYLDLANFAMPYFEEALRCRPNDPDTEEFIKLCQYGICIPTFTTPFSERVKKMWDAFSAKEPAWSKELYKSKVYQKTLEQIADQIAQIFSPFITELIFDPNAQEKRCSLAFKIDIASKFLLPICYMVHQAPANILKNWTITLGCQPHNMIPDSINIQGQEFDLTACQVKLVESDSLERQDAELRSAPSAQDDNADRVQFSIDPSDISLADLHQDSPVEESSETNDSISILADPEIATESEQSAQNKEAEDAKHSEMRFKYVVLIQHPIVAQMAKEIDNDTELESEALLNIYCNALVNVIRQLLGEKAMLFGLHAIRLNKQEDAFERVEGEAFPLSELGMRMEQLGYNLNMSDEQFIKCRRINFKRSLEWKKGFLRDDIYQGWTDNAMLFSDFYRGNTSYLNLFTYYGICVGFFAFEHDKEEFSPDQVLPARHKFIQFFNRLLQENPNIKVIGNSYGLQYDYIDVMVFENVHNTLDILRDFMLEHTVLYSNVYFAPFRQGYNVIIYEGSTFQKVEQMVKALAAQVDALYSGTASVVDNDSFDTEQIDLVSLTPISKKSDQVSQKIEATKNADSVEQSEPSNAVVYADDVPTPSKRRRKSASSKAETKAISADTLDASDDLVVSAIIVEPESEQKPRSKTAKTSTSKAAKTNSTTSKATKGIKATANASTQSTTKQAKKSIDKDAKPVLSESQLKATKTKATTAKTKAATNDESAEDDIISMVITEI